MHIVLADMHRKSVTLSPAQYLVKIFGGVTPMSRALGISSQRIYGWLRYRSRYGSSGRVPSHIQMLVLERAKSMGLDITEADLVVGREIEVESA